MNERDKRFPVAALVALEDSDVGPPRVELFDGHSVSFGRSESCTVQVAEAGASRLHARLFARANELLLTDLDSCNGTWVNDDLIDSCTLEHGDVVRVCSTSFRVDMTRMNGTSSTTRRAPAVPAGCKVHTKRRDALVRRRLEPDTVDLTIWTDRPSNPLAVLETLGRSLNRAPDLPSAAELLLDLVLETFPAERSTLLLYPEHNPDGDVRSYQSRMRSAGNPPPRVSNTILRDVIDERLSIVSADAASDNRYGGESIVQQNVRAVMCVPLESAEDVVGALYLDTQTKAGAFSEEDLELLAVIGKFAAEAVVRLRSVQRSRDTLVGAIRALVYAVEAKDRYTAGHSERVSDFGYAVSKELDLPESECRDVHLAGLLHDIGKIGVPEAILTKTGALTPEEYEIIKEHPERGADILRHLEGLACVIDGVRFHHERWDGAGYPTGLRALSIPRIARIVSVVDAVDAMTSDRSYTRIRTLEDVIEEVERCKSTQFDPEIAEATIACLRQGSLLPLSVVEAARRSAPPTRFGEALGT